MYATDDFAISHIAYRKHNIFSGLVDIIFSRVACLMQNVNAHCLNFIIILGKSLHLSSK